jgi:acetyl-CoA decarbonylase/synthase complex subunit gamma
VPGFERWLDTRAGRVPVISTQLTSRDRLGALAVRLDVGRDDYRVPPGLYALGEPDPSSPVIVTANYKLTFDHVRSALPGRNLWVLVLETFGINVWCAAGHGTFGTEELVRRVGAVRLHDVVDHRRLLLPMLGATGVAAHVVAERTGFHPRFAGIRIRDLPAYLDGGNKVTPAMRELSFSLAERLVLVPVELVGALKITALLSAAVFLLGAFRTGTFVWQGGLPPVVGLVGAVLAGAVGVPALLPWIPGRSFAFKGLLLGLAWAALFGWWLGTAWSWPEWLASLTLLPAIASFVGLNFTGSTPFTSISGVKKEMRIAIPMALAACLIGVIAYAVGGWI